ncbi:MAG: hypothetical protein SFU83_24675 [Meiothermus sp.]|nr:hypothetical protein [Meiothermus sp.]
MIGDLIGLYKRDLEKFAAELEAYRDDGSIWKLAGEIKNPAGNLAMHVVGNLNYYVGALLGGTRYVRNRPAEFETREGSRADLAKQLRETGVMIERVLGGFSREQLEAPFPQPIEEYPSSNQGFLMHLYGHLNWHLGQVNYHRRLVV